MKLFGDYTSDQLANSAKNLLVGAIKGLRTDAEVAAEKQTLNVQIPTPAQKGEELLLPRYAQPGIPGLQELGAQISKPFESFDAPIEGAQAVSNLASPIVGPVANWMTTKHTINLNKAWDDNVAPIWEQTIGRPPTEEEKARGEAFFGSMAPAAKAFTDTVDTGVGFFTKPNPLSEAIANPNPISEFVKPATDAYMGWITENAQLEIGGAGINLNKDFGASKVIQGQNQYSQSALPKTDNFLQGAWENVSNPDYIKFQQTKKETEDRASFVYKNFVETASGEVEKILQASEKATTYREGAIDEIGREAFKVATLGTNMLLDILERPMRKIILPHYWNTMYNLGTFMRKGKITQEDYANNKDAAEYMAGGSTDFNWRLADMANPTNILDPVQYFNKAWALATELTETENAVRVRLKQKNPLLEALDRQEIFGIPLIAITDTITSYASGYGEAKLVSYLTALGLMNRSKTLITVAKGVDTAQKFIWPVSVTTLAAGQGWLGEPIKKFVDEESKLDPNFGQAMSVLSGVAVLSTFFKIVGKVLKVGKFKKIYQQANNDPYVMKQMLDNFSEKFNQQVAVYKSQGAGYLTAEDLGVLFKQWDALPADVKGKMNDLTLGLFTQLASEGNTAGKYNRFSNELMLNTDTLKGGGKESGEVIYHEFAHAIEKGVMNDPVFGPMWKNLTKNVAFENVRGTNEPAMTTGDYKFANPGEYFAENFRMANKHPDILKATDPEMYDFMGKVSQKVGDAVIGGDKVSEFSPRQIPESLKPLYEEARKFKTPEEFMSAEFKKRPDYAKSEVQTISAPEAVAKGISKEEWMPRMKPEGERGFNVDQLNLTEPEALKVAQTASVMGLGDYKVRSWDDVQKMADELLMDPQTLLKNVNGNGLQDFEMQALKSLISINEKFITESVEALKTASPKLTEELTLKIDQANQQVDIALQKLLPSSTEIGRALNAHKLLAKNTLDPALWYIRAQKELGERKLSVDQKADIYALTQAKDINGLASYVALLRKPHWAEIASSLYKAGLLTSPSTHIANLGSNTVIGTLEAIVNDVIGSPLDKFISVFTKQRTIGYVGLIKRIGYIPDGLGKAYDQLKYGYDPTGKNEMFRQVQTGIGPVDKYMDIVFRSLRAEDKVFKQGALEASLYSQSKAQALNEGLKLNSPEYKARIEALKADPGLIKQADNEALYATFNNENLASTTISKMRQQALTKGSGVVYMASQLVAPFVRTPTNVALVGLDYTPVGFIKSLAQAAQGKQRAAILSFGRSLTGSSLIALGAYLNSQGMLTGTYPTSGDYKKKFQAQRIGPGNLVINGMQFDLMRLSPLGNLLQLGAAMYENYKDNDDIGKTLISAGFEGAKGLTEQTFLMGVAKTLDAITKGGGFAENWAESMVSGLVPTVVSQLAESSDQYQREQNGILDAIKYKIPGLRQTLLPKRDFLGAKMLTNDEDLIRINDWSGFFAKAVKRMFDPLKVSKVYTNELIDEYNRQSELGIEGAYPTVPSATQTLSTTVIIKGKKKTVSSKFKMTPEEYNMFRQIRGSLLVQAEMALIKTEKYKQMSEYEKERARSKKEEIAQDEARARITGKVDGVVNETMRAVFNQNHPEINEEFQRQLKILQSQ